MFLNEAPPYDRLSPLQSLSGDSLPQTFYCTDWPSCRAGFMSVRPMQCCLEILHMFKQGALHFHFPLDPTNCVASSACLLFPAPLLQFAKLCLYSLPHREHPSPHCHSFCSFSFKTQFRYYLWDTFFESPLPCPNHPTCGRCSKRVY